MKGEGLMEGEINYPKEKGKVSAKDKRDEGEGRRQSKMGYGTTRVSE